MNNITGNGNDLADLIYNLRCKCISRHEKIREQSGLSPAEFRAIRSLEPNDIISGSSFADLLELSPSRSSRVIDRMVKNGFIEVSRNDSDRRQITVALSDQGKELNTEIHNELNRCNIELEEALTEEDRIEIQAALQKLLNAM